MLGEKAGVISGSGAMLVDYVLTITISIAACVDTLFSYLPLSFHIYKVSVACCLCLMLIILNIRGVKESIVVMAPIFIVFVVTHLVMLLDGILTHTGRFVPMVNSFQAGIQQDISTIGFVGMLMLFLRAYSLGGGTYTGIEAVSNGMQIMREPRVQTGQSDNGLHGGFAGVYRRLAVSVLCASKCPTGGRQNAECRDCRQPVFRLGDRKDDCFYHDIFRG